MSSKFDEGSDSGGSEARSAKSSPTLQRSGHPHWSAHNSAGSIRSEPRSKVFYRTTDDTASDISTAHPYEVIEYDFNEGQASAVDLFADFDSLHIDDDSPAAAALAANASVRVSSLGKAARAVHMQTVRKIVKRATGATKSGVIRGKPPRLPPHLQGSGTDYSGLLEPIDEREEVAHGHKSNSNIGEESAAEPHNVHPPGPPGVTVGVVPGTAEAGKEVLEHVDTHDLLKLLRWRRNGKAGNQKKPKSYVKGKVIDGEHELYALSIAVMIGVRTSISRTNTELNSGPGHRWVTGFDFKTAEKYEFRPKGGSMTPPHMLAHTFKFKDYAPVVFAYLRRMAGVNEFDFLLSVCGNANFIEFVSNAKSGQFFFYSNDGRYMIKTMTNAESKFLRRMLPEYFKHCAENPNTMITRFFGMYRVKLYHLRRNVKFVIMNSVYNTDKYLQKFYDLKGSVIGREAKPGQIMKKDNDLRRGLPAESLALKQPQRERIRQQVKSDCDFLTNMGVMDYSMLVGIHLIPASPDERRASAAHRNFRSRSKSAVARSEIDFAELEAIANNETPNRNSITNNVRHSVSLSQENDLPGRSSMSHKVGRHSVNDGVHHRLSESIGAFFFDNGLEEDDSSYLEGADGTPPKEGRAFNVETERKKQATVEKLFWPFHRYFDIHGNRRLHPVTCMQCDCKPCECPDDEHLLKGYNIPRFIPPNSTRKDGGLEMETSGQKLPMRFKGAHGEEQFEGKIFYMGIIDVLQEYNARKAIEATYRTLRSSKNQASCVAPIDYSTRFVDFFDEYTQPLPPNTEMVVHEDGGGQNSPFESVPEESESELNLSNLKQAEF